MIKTTEDILDMCEEWNNDFENGKLHYTKEKMYVNIPDPRPLYYKEWVDKEKLIKKLEMIEYALEYDMYDEKKPVEYLMKVIDDTKKLLDDLIIELRVDK